MIIKINNKNIEVIYYKSYFKKLIGFMFKHKKITTGICLVNTNSIHTFFMFQNIDILMTDKDNNILHAYPNFSPNKTILPKKGVYYTYELPINTLNIKNNSIKKPNITI